MLLLCCSWLKIARLSAYCKQGTSVWVIMEFVYPKQWFLASFSRETGLQAAGVKWQCQGGSGRMVAVLLTLNGASSVRQSDVSICLPQRCDRTFLIHCTSGKLQCVSAYTDAMPVSGRSLHRSRDFSSDSPVLAWEGAVNPRRVLSVLVSWLGLFSDRIRQQVSGSSSFIPRHSRGRLMLCVERTNPIEGQIHWCTWCDEAFPPQVGSRVFVSI